MRGRLCRSLPPTVRRDPRYASANCEDLLTQPASQCLRLGQAGREPAAGPRLLAAPPACCLLPRLAARGRLQRATLHSPRSKQLPCSALLARPLVASAGFLTPKGRGGAVSAAGLRLFQAQKPPRKPSIQVRGVGGGPRGGGAARRAAPPARSAPVGGSAAAAGRARRQAVHSLGRTSLVGRQLSQLRLELVLALQSSVGAAWGQRVSAGIRSRMAGPPPGASTRQPPASTPQPPAPGGQHPPARRSA